MHYYILFYIIMKDQQSRLAECIEIRRQVDKLGVMMNEHVQKQFTKYMNEFIKEGTSHTFKTRLDYKHNVRVKLSTSCQSGFVLEKL